MHAVLNSYQHFNAWSPWAERDPDATYAFEGPDAGVGAKMIWAGNAQVGAGFQEITASTPDRIDVHLDFGSQGAGDAYFLITEGEDGTAVTWAFETEHGMNLVARYMGLMIGKYVGQDYEEGLAKLKEFVESLPQTNIAGFVASEEEVAAQPILFVPISGKPDEVSAKLGEAYGEIVAFMNSNGVQFAGMPLSVQKDMSEG